MRRFRYTELDTKRPVFAELSFCQLSDFDLESDAAVATHELLHALVRP